MAVKIKLKRMGKIRAPYYRIVVADARTKRDGRAIEEIGIYHPKEDPSRMEVNSERAQYWLGVGAQPTEPVVAIFKRTGDWQTFKGEPAPPPLLVKAPKPSRSELYHAAVAEAHGEEDPTVKADRAATTRPKKSRSSGSDDAPSASTTADATPSPASDPAADSAETVAEGVDAPAANDGADTADSAPAPAADDAQA